MKKAICGLIVVALLLMMASALASITVSWADDTLTISTTDTIGVNKVLLDGADTFIFVGDTAPVMTYSVPADGKTHTVTTVPMFGATGGSATFVAGEAPTENWDEGKVTKEPTCEEPGEKVYTDLKDPTKTKTEVIPAKGHTIEKTGAKAATCTEPGNTGLEKCTVCGKVLNDSVEIPAKGHQWDNGVTAKPATETEEGEMVYTCTVCGETKTEVIPRINPKDGPLEATFISYERTMLNFSVKNLAPMPGEAWVDGASTGITVYNGNNSIAIYLKPGTHTLVVHGNGETCTIDFEVPEPKTPVISDASYQNGVLTFTIENLNGLGEIWVSGENAGTASNNGVVTTAVALQPGDYTVLVHDSMFGLTSNTLSFHVHKLVAIGEDKEATCTEDGYKAGCECELCGEVLEEAAVIPAMGHDVVEEPAVEATCTEDGITAGSHCARCGEVLEEAEVIPALGHDVVVEPAVEATCTKDGLTEGSHCARCGEVLEEQKTVKALGHKYQAQNPKAVMRQEYVCSRCGDKYTEEQKNVRNAYGSILRNANGEYVDYVANIDARDSKTLVITATIGNGEDWISEIGMYLTKDLIDQISNEGFTKIAYVNDTAKVTVTLSSLSDKLFAADGAINEYVITLDPKAEGGCLVKVEATLQAGDKVEAGEFPTMPLEFGGNTIQVTTNGVYA